MREQIKFLSLNLVLNQLTPILKLTTQNWKAIIKFFVVCPFIKKKKERQYSLLSRSLNILYYSN